MTFTIPNTFIAGKKAIAQEVNENFNVIKEELNKQSASLADSSTLLETTRKYVYDDLKKELTDLINVSEVPFCPNEGFADENGNNNSLFLPNDPILATKSLPTFANVSAAENGANGVRVEPSGAFNVIGANNPIAGGYIKPYNEAYNLVFTFDTPKKVTAYTFLGGYKAYDYWISVFTSLQASNDGNTWVTLKESNLVDSTAVNLPLTNEDSYLIYRFNNVRVTSSYNGGGKPHALGAVNLFYEDVVNPTNAEIVLQASQSAPFVYTNAKGKTFKVENNLVLDLGKNFSSYYGSANVFANNGNLEAFVNTIYKQNKQPNNPQQNDVWFKTYEPFASFQYKNNEWVNYDGAPIGKTTLNNGTVTTVQNFAYNQNGYNVNLQTWGPLKLKNDTKPAVIVDTWSYSTSWYRVWSDGFIEQGGYVGGNTNQNFFIPFTNTDFNLAFGSSGTANGTPREDRRYRTTTYFGYSSATVANTPSDWVARGY